VTTSVRPCGSLADVAAIEREVPTGRADRHRTRYERGDGSVYLLAWLDGRAVGHVLVTPESKYVEIRRALGSFPEVNALGVAESWRGRGVGRALMTAAAEVAGELGAGRLGLACERENEPAVRLYRSMGFEPRPGLDVVDVWTWLDDEGGEHEERDLCAYWVLEAARS
jgi:GNAT superfamily N-acetyltransferase